MNRFRIALLAAVCLLAAIAPAARADGTIPVPKDGCTQNCATAPTEDESSWWSDLINYLFGK